MTAHVGLFGTKARRDAPRFPALTDAEREAILATRKPTKCPPATVAITFKQQPARRDYS